MNLHPGSKVFAALEWPDYTLEHDHSEYQKMSLQWILKFGQAQPKAKYKYLVVEWEN